ncbi:TetR/AcrR family tetracycline transcriptional repressor [Kibdelosporangium banguiense]|uniref:TetR/AcrR family tetracycline transcriptional repressor n=1 Tax=Kibdelosporangium banguiense TaxID=1365924 RepID=A0ABS4TNL4_9PSEU|nr:TetR/AcrR family transcriptional regulator [Kibdelosporangium banguiense]MBP2325990.1 TetR/AcrR family tetracycline transcriptional repressor [Kibdelosporangium banguiense]
MPPRRGRPPAAEPKLQADVIVAAGLATLQAEGLDGLTMSRVADRIGVRAASLYWHVRDKEELLDLIADAIAAAYDLSTHVDPQDWRGSLAAMMRAMRRHMLAYRDSARLLLGRFSTGPGQLRSVETMLGVLRGAGFSGRDASYALFLLTTFISGFVGGEQAPLSASVAAGQSARSYLDDLGSRMAALDAEEFPHTVALAGDLTAPDLDSRFEFALDRLLDGISVLAQ